MYDENYLMHYGILGMHWGRRTKNTEVASARKAYYDAKKTRQSIRREAPAFGFGIKGIAKTEEVGERFNKSQIDVLDKKAAYKMSKETTEKGKLRIERKVYQRAMNRIGLPGSVNDTAMYNGLGKVLAKHLQEKKGKEYADQIIKKTQNKAITELVVGGSIAIGAAIAASYLEYKG